MIKTMLGGSALALVAGGSAFGIADASIAAATDSKREAGRDYDAKLAQMTRGEQIIYSEEHARPRTNGAAILAGLSAVPVGILGASMAKEGIDAMRGLSIHGSAGSEVAGLAIAGVAAGMLTASIIGIAGERQ